MELSRQIELVNRTVVCIVQPGTGGGSRGWVLRAEATAAQALAAGVLEQMCLEHCFATHSSSSCSAQMWIASRVAALLIFMNGPPPFFHLMELNCHAFLHETEACTIKQPLQCFPFQGQQQLAPQERLAAYRRCKACCCWLLIFLHCVDAGGCKNETGAAANKADLSHYCP